MDVVSVFVVVLVIAVFATDYINLESVKTYFTKKKVDTVVWPDEKDITPHVPEPTPDVHPHDITIVGIVDGWNCFKTQCEDAGLHDVVTKLDAIFPMLIKVEDKVVSMEADNNE